ncbi:hypothetical protein Pmar_PMAR002547 [Perkinsus marinus ATCC 50983]|uniref:Uncharacterized protein n=1 Tax=Perkinsus marinus (strain ATCC 50983 / TXsc) TaxID=423536 RepID=C5LRB4_PERM5|nr:hypothetical protein Pmar_PMAR002547 [Perkinsus marinus ATCC 50983]EER00728.1 hypothetical protein Pmar_PMAR002547 [Perkinsus marinus ATCC 50983]|eukprot:XP_002768010.1 hypothetical protein Pmar_PMAR002547 [Perkinsus marinus ATCC 50983]
MAGIRYTYVKQDFSGGLVDKQEKERVKADVSARPLLSGSQERRILLPQEP